MGSTFHIASVQRSCTELADIRTKSRMKTLFIMLLGMLVVTMPFVTASIDSDGDGLTDIEDDDDDNDGLLDTEDDDDDGDGNDEDGDDDGDGILDGDEDDDGDGVENDEDPDDDGDGIIDEDDEL